MVGGSEGVKPRSNGRCFVDVERYRDTHSLGPEVTMREYLMKKCNYFFIEKYKGNGFNFLSIEREGGVVKVPRSPHAR